MEHEWQWMVKMCSRDMETLAMEGIARGWARDRVAAGSSRWGENASHSTRCQFCMARIRESRTFTEAE